MFYTSSMADPESPLTPADPSEIVDATAFALRFAGRNRVHSADEIMAGIVARRLVEHLEEGGLRRHEAATRDRRLGKGFDR